MEEGLGLIVGFLLGAATGLFVGAIYFVQSGYAHGCADGSHGKASVVSIDGSRKCLPIEQVDGLKK